MWRSAGQDENPDVFCDVVIVTVRVVGIGEDVKQGQGPKHRRDTRRKVQTLPQQAVKVGEREVDLVQQRRELLPV